MSALRKLWLVLAVNTAGAIIPAILMQLFRPGATWHDFWGHFQFSLFYSFCIGTLAFLVMERVGPELHRFSRPVMLLVMIATFATLAVIGSLIANLCLLALRWESGAEFRDEFVGGVRIAIFLTILIGAAVTVFESLHYRLRTTTLELRTRQLEEERVRKLATQAKLSSLESRIHPHFLFNTLNSISALIREDPQRAERTVERLAALLRYSLDTNAQRLVPLRQELYVVEDYLEIEKTRFGDRLRCTLDVPDDLGDLEVPPLAVQTLVENSIKHAVTVNRQGGEIRVTARATPERLVLEVADDGPGFDLQTLEHARGHGLGNLQERLAALFDGDGRLELARRDGRMTVAVTVPRKRVLV